MKLIQSSFIILCFLISINVFSQTSVLLEAENAKEIYHAAIDKNHLGHTGTGFVNFDNENGSSISFNLELPQINSFTLYVKYANESSDRTMDVLINDVLVQDKLNFPSTGLWTTWNTLSFKVDLSLINTIKFVSSNPNGGPNIDWIMLENRNISINLKPVAINDTLSLSVNQQFYIPVLNNDYDLNKDDFLTIVSVDQPAEGQVILESDNSIKYIPKKDFTGDDSFSYTISDGTNETTANVILTINNIDWSVEFANWIVETKTPANVGSWNYTVGLLLEGLLRVYMRTEDITYLNFVDEWAKIHISETGVLDNNINSLDNMMPGFTILHLYSITHNDRYRKVADIIRNNYNTFPRTSDGGFWHNKAAEGQLWLDGLYMSTPFIASYGQMLGDEEYCYNEVIKQYKTYIHHLKNEESGILVHAYDEDGSASWALPPLNRSPHHWGRSVGWVMMGLMEVIDIIPKDHPEKDSLIDIYTSILTNLIPYQDKRTGLWNQIINLNEDDRNWNETSSSIMYTLAMKRAVQNGHLPDSFNKYIDLAYSGILSKISIVNNYARLIDVCQGTSVSSDIQYYLNRSRVTNDNHGVGAFLIMNELLAYNNLPWQKNENLSVNDAVKYSEFSVYPNPCADYVVFDIDNPQDKIVDMKIYSIDGRLLKTQKETSNKIDFSDLEPGIYFLNVKTTTKLFSTKIIKN